MTKRFFKKLVSFTLSFNLLFQSFLPLFVMPIYADDSTPSATTSDITPTPELTPTPTETVTPTPEITPDTTPTPTLDPTPNTDPTPAISPEATPSPTIEVTPTIEITPTTTPEISAEPTSSPDAQAPPASDDQTNNSSDPSTPTTPDTAPTVTDLAPLPESLNISSNLEQSLTLQPTLTTDKADYFPTDIAYISGTGFLPNTTYTLHIMSSDMPFVSFKVEVTSDETGYIFYAYQLDGNYRPNYSIDALDASGTAVTSMTFTDSRTVISVKLNSIALASGGKAIVLGASTIATVVTVTNDSGSEWQSTGWRINSSSGPYACINHGDHNNDGTFSESFNITSPSATGTYNVYMQAFSDDSCGSGSSGSFSYTNGVVVVPNPSWPTGWTTPSICSIDPTGDESPSGTDLVGDVTTPAAGFSTDTNFRYFRERVAGDPSGSGVFGQYAWVVLFQTGVLASPYQYLGSMNGKDELVQLWQNTSTGGNLVFNPLLNDPAETKLWEGPGGTFARIVNAGSGFYYVDWAIPKAAMPSGIVDGTTKFFATSANENNFNKDHLNCYEAPTTGTIELKKVWSGTASQTTLKIGTTSGGTQTDSQLTGVAGATPQTTGPNTVPAGTYYLSETAITGYSPILSCFNDANNNGQNDTEASVTVGANNSVSLAVGQHVVCTFTNTLNVGTIVVHKDVQGPAGEDVTDGSNYFEVSLDGGTGQAISDNLTTTFTGVSVGNHTITESLVDTDYTRYGISTTAGQVGTPTGLVVNVASGQTVDVYVTNRQKSGTITVIKDVVSSTGGAISDTHSFTANLSPGAQSSLLAEGSNAVFTVNPGTYTVSETADSGYTNEGCLTATGKEDIVVGSGESITVTCTNRQNPGTLIVKKVVVGSNVDPNTFSFSVGNNAPIAFESDGQNDLSVNSGSYTVTETANTSFATQYDNCTDVLVTNGGSATCTITNTRKTGNLYLDKIIFGGGPASETSWSFTIGGIQGSWVDGQFTTLNTGTYTVTESTGVLGYSLTSVSGCTGLNGQTANVTVGEGNQTCSFTNTRDTGSVKVNKYIDLNGDGDFSDSNETNNTNAHSLGFRWLLDGSGSNSMGSTVASIPTTIPNSVTHSINENSVEDYHLVGWFLNGSGKSCTNLSGTTLPATVNVTKGDLTEITLCNQKDVGSIKIVKDVFGGTNDQDFTFTGSGVLGSFTLDDNGSESTSNGGKPSFKLFSGISAGSYTVTETNIPTSWIVNSLTCTGDPDYQVNGNTVTIDLDHSENVICTFVNRQQTGTITIIKDAQPNSDDNFDFDVNGSFPGGDFELEDDGSDNNGGTEESKTVTVVTGQYTVEEDGESGWKLTNLVCDDQNSTVNLGNKRATINVEANENVTCTFTNQKLGTLIIKKETTNNSDDNFRFDRSFGDDFELEDDGDDNNGGTDETATFSSLNPGSYTVTENTLSGWVLSDIVCSDQTVPNIQGRSVTVDLSYNETVTCTFKNTRLGRIEGEKFNDKNGDGDQDSGESDMDDWRIFIDGNDNGLYDNGETYDWTDDGGDYSFNNLLPGTYTVCEQMQNGWYNSTPICRDTTLTAGDTDDIDFANHQAITLLATKIVCDLESDLPNWGTGAPNITSTTAQNFLSTHPGCRLESGWDFQYGFDGEVDKYGNGDQLGAAPSPWMTLGSTNGSGVASATITDLDDHDGIWVREVLKENYVPFTYPPSGPTEDSYSAEIYCSVDGNRYDNFDQVDNPLFGNTYYCVAFNALNFGSLSGYKWDDNNDNHERDCEYSDSDRIPDNNFCEDKLGNWSIFIDENEDGILNNDERETSTDSDGNYFFPDLTPGTYSVCEVEQGGWTRTTPQETNCQEVTVNAGSETENVNFGNRRVDARLLISRSNNASGPLSPGSSVEHTIKIKILDNDVSTLQFIDLLPKGFVFRPGSYSVFSGLVNITGSISAPVYNSPGIWELGDHSEDDVLTITYLADINGDVLPGLYDDLAWASASDAYDQGLTFQALGENSEYVSENFVGTDVEVIKDQTRSDDYNVEKKETVTGQVLGASTDLPATGANELWLLAALLSLYFGIKLVRSAKTK